MILPPPEQSRGPDPGAPTASTGRQNKRLVNRPYLNSNQKKSHEVTIYEGGSLVHLRGEKVESMVDYPQGKTRGKIKEFSSRSRQRLMRQIAMIDTGAAGLPVFLTLTYPNEYPTNHEVWKKHLNHFLVMSARRFEEMWGNWKLEFQKRGAPHFHLMLWGLPEIKGTKHERNGETSWRVLPGISCKSDLQVYDWLNNTWFRVVGSNDEKHLRAGINLEPVKSWNGVMSYVSKYLAKTDSGEFVPVEHTGRFWGVIGAKKWKITKFEAGMTEEVFFRMRRVIRKCQERARKKAVRKAKEAGRRVPAWARSKRPSGPGIHWFMNSVISMRLLGWASTK